MGYQRKPRQKKKNAALYSPVNQVLNHVELQQQPDGALLVAARAKQLVLRQVKQVVPLQLERNLKQHLQQVVQQRVHQFRLKQQARHPLQRRHPNNRHLT